MQFQHPSVYVAASPINELGLFSSTPISSGEVIAVWSGFITTAAEINLKFADARYRNCSQIGEDQFLVPHAVAPADHINHSCNPNCGIRGSNTLAAMRDIPPAEEITYDYAMTDGCDYDVFVCRCRAPQCRRRITGSDWKNPILQFTYQGWFSDYIAEMIAQLDHRD